MSGYAGGTSSLTRISATKQSTIAKLIDRFWDGKLAANDMDARLPEGLWDCIREFEDKEEMQRAAKRFTNKVRQGFREEKRQGRQLQKKSREQVLLQKYALLALPVPEVEALEVDWLSAPRAVVPELNCLPARRYFALRQSSLLGRELRKLREKRQQIAYLAKQVLERLRVAKRPIRRIVDFGGGRGDFALALAWLLGRSEMGRIPEIVVLELEAAYCEQGRKRSAALAKVCPEAARVNFVCTDLRHFQEPFELAVGLHACGPLVDAVLLHCFASRAEFVLLTCCFGKIPKRCDDFELSYPRAGSALIRGREDFFELCRLADAPVEKESAQAMRLLNSDRCCWVRQRGGWAHLCCIPRSVTNKNVLVVGAADALEAGVLDVTARAVGAWEGLKGLAPATISEQPPGTLRIVMVADTHCRHRQLSMPPGDLLLVCGDFTKSGLREEVEDFAAWLDSLPYTAKVVVAGNHEITFDHGYYNSKGHVYHKDSLEPINPAQIKEIIAGRAGLHYLEDELLELRIGEEFSPIRIFGSPSQGPFFSDHSMAAFGRSFEQEAKAQAAVEAGAGWPTAGDCCKSTPVESIDILVTHGPAYGICDLSSEHEQDGRAAFAGSKALLKAVLKQKPVLHAFGHIHEGYGVRANASTYFVNSAICSERYIPQRLPIVCDLLRAGPQEARGLRFDGGRFYYARPASNSSYGESGRPHKGQEEEGEAGGSSGVSSLYVRLMHELHDGRPELHTATNSSGYRNKASFSLGKQFVGEQESCAGELNELAGKLQELAKRDSDSEFFVEAALKLTRSGRLGVKLVLRGEEAVDSWLKGRGASFAADLRAIVPAVQSVTYQVAPAGSDEKPPKSPWHPRYPMFKALYGDPFVIEDAPVGLPGQYLPYRLSPDSFSEVNGKAEEAMIQVLCGWVEELVQTGQAKTLCMFGRNSGFIGLALQHRFGFNRVYAHTHCPVTLADAEASVAMNSAPGWILGRCEKYDFGGVLAKIPEGEGPLLVHVTNSRHGLAEGVIPALKRRRDVYAVAYNSCSHLPLPAEWTELCSGPGAFEIRKFRSFDLLAGTEFLSSYFLLVRRPATLILPVGPPGVGKSWIARQLAATAACTVFERDLAFFEERLRSEVGFAEAKRRSARR
ncbi:Mpped1 [Symbiodinium sp. CCMP2592]|nr:Mpped1 [Symbiodinium sp. CCMP2592]